MNGLAQTLNMYNMVSQITLSQTVYITFVNKIRSLSQIPVYVMWFVACLPLHRSSGILQHVSRKSSFFQKGK